jgi:hypothetical protein
MIILLPSHTMCSSLQERAKITTIDVFIISRHSLGCHGLRHTRPPLFPYVTHDGHIDLPTSHMTCSSSHDRAQAVSDPSKFALASARYLGSFVALYSSIAATHNSSLYPVDLKILNHIRPNTIHSHAKVNHCTLRHNVSQK